MLRRIDHAKGTDDWLLVPQIEHARLSGRLAETWIDAALATIEPHSELVEAIARHDDGWAEWDAAPQVDAATGRPLSFMEMPLADSIEIWTRSIRRAAALGNLAAHVVSGHFTALLTQALPRWSADPRQFQLCRAFLDEQGENRERWLAAWQRENPEKRSRRMAQQALAYLQLFDALSLWLCGGARVEPARFPVPQGYELGTRSNGDNRFVFVPWPLRVDRLQAAVGARRVPVARYANAAALANTSAALESIDLELVGPDAAAV